MNLSYRLATLSYCPDLTDPGAVSLPIAVLAVGKSQDPAGVWTAAAVGLDATRLGMDPLSTAMLADMPHLIRRHVDEGLKRLTAAATPGVALDAFRESLKTSIHVSAVSEDFPLEVATTRDIAPALFDAAYRVLEGSLRKVREQVDAAPPRTPPRWTPRVEPEQLLEQAPEQLSWRPRGSDENHAAAG